MESYVVRIYRRHEADPERVVGLVEHPENGAVERFSGAAELVSILLAPPQDQLAVAAEKPPNAPKQTISHDSVVTLRSALLHRNRSS